MEYQEKWFIFHPLCWEKKTNPNRENWMKKSAGNTFISIKFVYMAMASSCTATNHPIVKWQYNNKTTIKSIPNDGECELAGEVDQKKLLQVKMQIEEWYNVGVQCTMVISHRYAHGGRAQMQEIDQMNKICELKRHSNAFRFISIGSKLGKSQATLKIEVNDGLLWAPPKNDTKNW